MESKNFPSALADAYAVFLLKSWPNFLSSQMRKQILFNFF